MRVNGLGLFGTSPKRTLRCALRRERSQDARRDSPSALRPKGQRLGLTGWVHRRAPFGSHDNAERRPPARDVRLPRFDIGEGAYLPVAVHAESIASSSVTNVSVKRPTWSARAPGRSRVAAFPPSGLPSGVHARSTTHLDHPPRQDWGDGFRSRRREPPEAACVRWRTRGPTAAVGPRSDSGLDGGRADDLVDLCVVIVTGQVGVEPLNQWHLVLQLQ